MIILGFAGVGFMAHRGKIVRLSSLTLTLAFPDFVFAKRLTKQF
jgi:hypothetical protein